MGRYVVCHKACRKGGEGERGSGSKIRRTKYVKNFFGVEEKKTKNAKTLKKRSEEEAARNKIKVEGKPKVRK